VCTSNGHQFLAPDELIDESVIP